MKKLILTAILATGVYAQGVVPYAGLTMNASSSVDSASPLGVFGVDYEWKYGSIGVKHTSSIPQVDETQGINEVVGKLTYKLGPVEPYVGVTWTTDTLTSEYYTEQLGTTSKIVGASVKYKSADIYAQYRDTPKQNMIEYGAVFKFYPEELMW